MSQDADAEARHVRVLTIGHSNHSQEAFISLLRQQVVDVLVDVRSQPHSRYAPHFDAPALKAAVTREGIRYLFLGRELGGRPEGAQFYDAEGFVLYSRIAESPLFQDGISRLERGIQQYRVAVMCSEENPLECHRRLLIGRVLADRGIEVGHIRGDGTVQTEAQLAADGPGQPTAAGQLALFETEPVEEKPWKSTRSVSQRGPRAPSSES